MYEEEIKKGGSYEEKYIKWKEYINYVRENEICNNIILVNKIVKKQSLYERVIQDYGYEEDIWNEYIAFYDSLYSSLEEEKLTLSSYGIPYKGCRLITKYDLICKGIKYFSLVEITKITKNVLKNGLFNDESYERVFMLLFTSLINIYLEQKTDSLLNEIIDYTNQFIEFLVSN